MEVVATRDGHYDGRIRKAGDAFRLATKQAFSDRWMVEKGTKKYADFVAAHERGGQKINTRDAINGERLTSGGIAEQLAIALEENRKLKAEIAALKSGENIDEGDEYQEPKPVEAPTPASEATVAPEQTGGSIKKRTRRKV